MPTPIQQEKPPRLSELQGWLRWIFTEPRGINAALDGGGDMPRKPEPAPRLLSWISKTPPIDVRRRLAVYADAYFLRLLDSLGSDFKAVRRALGEQKFRALAADYLQAHPSTSPNIADLGRLFPGFVRTHPLNKKSPFLSDIAALEWNFLACLYTDRLPPFDPSALQNTPPEAWSGARLILDPTVRLLDIEWPVLKLWKCRELPEKRGARALKRQGRQQLLLYRGDDWVNIHPVSGAEFLLLEKLREGCALGAACLKLQEADLPAGPDAIQSWFSMWTASGVVKGVEFQRP